jgi:hypothetical protein
MENNIKTEQSNPFHHFTTYFNRINFNVLLEFTVRSSISFVNGVFVSEFVIA